MCGRPLAFKAAGLRFSENGGPRLWSINLGPEAK
jgi:hypothetical protein